MLNIGQVVTLRTPKEEHAISPGIYIGQELVDSKLRQKFYTNYDKVYWTTDIEDGYTFLFLDDKFYKSPLQIGTVSKALTQSQIDTHKSKFLKVLGNITNKMYGKESKT
jgi:hypothetical protein